MTVAWITGGNGFIGQHLARALAERGFSLVVIDPAPPPSDLPADTVWLATAVENANLANLPVPTHIYHLACTSADPRIYQTMPVETLTMCLSATVAVCRYAIQHNARVLLASSSEVYGDPDVSPIPEAYPGRVNNVGPRACYDNGKRIMETLAGDFHRTLGLNACIARIFNTYGPGMTDSRVISSFMRHALSDGVLTIYGTGEHSRCFCYVSDMVHGLIALMEAASVTCTTPVNLGNPGTSRSVHALATTVCAMANKATGGQAGIKFAKAETDDPVQRCPDISRARRLLHWRPEVELEQGLALTLAWWMQQENCGQVLPTTT